MAANWLGVMPMSHRSSDIALGHNSLSNVGVDNWNPFTIYAPAAAQHKTNVPGLNGLIQFGVFIKQCTYSTYVATIVLAIGRLVRRAMLRAYIVSSTGRQRNRGDPEWGSGGGLSDIAAIYDALFCNTSNNIMLAVHILPA
jgi:hypothetical protein